MSDVGFKKIGVDADLRIIDRSGKKRLPIGNEDFSEVIRRSVFVDKSMLVRDIIDSSYSAILFCRPRRFGKSLAMRMLQCYFEAPVEGYIVDQVELFHDLVIWGQGEEYRREQGAHPVVYLSLGSARHGCWEDSLARMAALVATEANRHAYLLRSDAISPAEKSYLDRIMTETGSRSDVEMSLSRLSNMLSRHHGAKTVILIDEYDQMVTAGHLHGYRDEAISFMRSWLTDALKATTSLYVACLTGVQRVSRESIFSGLNNIEVNTTLSTEFTEGFGFTEAEAEALAGYCGAADRLGEMRDWYDGYVFGGERVYNPWSLLNYLAAGGVAQPYWGNTSSNSIVHDLFEQARGPAAEELAALAAGGTVSEPIDLATVFDMIGRDPQAIWSQLYLAGYLTTEDTAEPNNVRKSRRLRVPNREVAELYRLEFADRSALIAGDRSRLRPLHEALAAGDAPALEAALRRILLDSPSALDLVRENSYHMLLLGLLYDVEGYRFPVSNREAGDGRADVLLVPERENRGKLPSVVVEVKWARALGGGAPDRDDAPGAAGHGGAPDAAGLSALAAEALAQVDLRLYADALPEGPVLRWGVAFSGKRAAAVCA